MASSPTVGAGTRILVLSPHLDDGVLSLGAFIATSVEAGAEVRILTIFGGDPESKVAAGRWDGRAGFASAADATEKRRAEDHKACAVLGAHHEWLPYLDKDYGPPPTDDAVWGQLAHHVDGADFVFVPGRPLIHPDHAWVSQTLTDRTDAAKLVFYAELPYDAWPKKRRNEERIADVAATRTWTSPRASLGVRVRKWRATGAYVTQLPWLARRGYRLAVLKSRFGRERLAWPQS